MIVWIVLELKKSLNKLSCDCHSCVNPGPCWNFGIGGSTSSSSGSCHLCCLLPLCPALAAYGQAQVVSADPSLTVDPVVGEWDSELEDELFVDLDLRVSPLGSRTWECVFHASGTKSLSHLFQDFQGGVLCFLGFLRHFDVGEKIWKNEKVGKWYCVGCARRVKSGKLCESLAFMHELHYSVK